MPWKANFFDGCLSMDVRLDKVFEKQQKLILLILLILQFHTSNKINSDVVVRRDSCDQKHWEIEA